MKERTPGAFHHDKVFMQLFKKLMINTHDWYIQITNEKKGEIRIGNFCVYMICIILQQGETNGIKMKKQQQQQQVAQEL